MYGAEEGRTIFLPTTNSPELTIYLGLKQENEINLAKPGKSPTVQTSL